MALVSGTTTSYDLKGNREDLQDKIFNVAPSETPFMSAIGGGKAVSTKHEWQVDTYAAAAANAQLEGDDYAYSTAAATTRVGNFTQISTKTFLITNTQEIVDKAGRKSEIKYQTVKKGVELKKDMERALLSNQASVAGAAGTARQLGGLAAWLTTNVDRGASGANGGYNTGTGLVAAATNGTQRAFTATLLDNVLQSAANNSGVFPNTLLMSSDKLVTMQGFTQRATAYREVGAKTPIVVGGNVSVYSSPFGDLNARYSYIMSADTALKRNVYAVSPSMASVKYLRRVAHDVPAKTGDAEKHALVVEYTLCVNNEAAHGIVADLT